MLERFSTYLQNIIPDYKTAKLLVAVSGGLDSMVLMHLVKQVSSNIGVAHCNYQLRGIESEKDEALVIAQAIQLAIPLYGIQFDTEKRLKNNPAQSLQMLARTLRYDWFDKICELHGYQYVLTAHHSNDSIETALYNFSQGTGIRGLTGIPEVNGKIIRPLLNFTKQELYSFAEEQNICFREDASNTKNKYKRNQIRNTIIPKFMGLNPNFEKNAAKSIKHLKEARIIYEQAIKLVRSKFQSQREGKTIIDLIGLKEEKASSTLLFELLSPFGFTVDNVESILKVNGKGSGQLFESSRYTMLFDREELVIKTKQTPSNSNIHFSIDQNETDFNTFHFTLETKTKTSDFKLDKQTHIAYLDRQKLARNLEIRTWKPGDKFQPFGMNGKHQKLQDFFINAGLSRFEKDEAPIFLSDHQICWVAGHRIDERFKVTDQTKEVLIIKMKVASLPIKN